jgi:hypothetical protein
MKMTWKRKGLGLTRLSSNGYLVFAGEREAKLFHVAVAELALGKPLPDGAVVHHVDGDKLNNWPYNLVICKDQAYHKLIHQRTNAYDECGHADWLKCKFCGQYDDPANLRIYATQRKGRNALDQNIHHQACNAYYLKTRYHLKKEI